MERKGANNHQEKFAAEKYNTRSLMDAYRQLTDPHDMELAEEISEDGENPNQGALMHTYAQVMDSYREGTIKQRDRGERSENKRR